MIYLKYYKDAHEFIKMFLDLMEKVSNKLSQNAYNLSSILKRSDPIELAKGFDHNFDLNIWFR